MAEKIRLLFLCTGNACRSQMAEGWTRHLRGNVIDVWSAGVEKHGLNPQAVRVMAEAGVEISDQVSQTMDELLNLGLDFDHVVTVCRHAHETCPVFPRAAKIMHVGFDDPPRLAAEETDPERALDHYRRVREDIRAFVETLPKALE